MQVSRPMRGPAADVFDSLPYDLVSRVCQHLDIPSLAHLERTSLGTRDTLAVSGWQRAHYQNPLGLLHREPDGYLMRTWPGLAHKILLREKHLLTRIVMSTSSGRFGRTAMAKTGSREAYLASMPMRLMEFHDLRREYASEAEALRAVGETKWADQMQAIADLQRDLAAAVEQRDELSVQACLDNGAQPDCCLLNDACSQQHLRIATAMIKAISRRGQGVNINSLQPDAMYRPIQAKDRTTQEKLNLVKAMLDAGLEKTHFWHRLVLLLAPKTQVADLLLGLRQLGIPAPSCTLPFHQISYQMAFREPSELSGDGLRRCLLTMQQIWPEAARGETRAYDEQEQSPLDELLRRIENGNIAVPSPFSKAQTVATQNIKILVDVLLEAGCPVDLDRHRSRLPAQDLAYLKRMVIKKERFSRSGFANRAPNNTPQDSPH